MLINNNRYLIAILFTIYHLPFTIYHLPFTIYHLPITNYQLPITNYQFTIIIHYPLSIKIPDKIT